MQQQQQEQPQQQQQQQQQQGQQQQPTLETEMLLAKKDRQIAQLSEWTKVTTVKYSALKTQALQDREELNLVEREAVCRSIVSKWIGGQKRYLQIGLVQLETFSLAQRGSESSVGLEKYRDELTIAKAERRQLRSDASLYRAEVDTLREQLAAVSGEKERLSVKFEVCSTVCPQQLFALN